MTLNSDFNKFSTGKNWEEKVLDADKIWAQVKEILAKEGQTLPPTPRRPDVRLIVNNTSGHDLFFKNPGDHSGSKMEHIPAEGKQTAVMSMIKGATLEEQYKNAETLYNAFNLGAEGFSDDFLNALSSGQLSNLIDEAYGPAPFEGQISKLTDVRWTSSDKTTIHCAPEKGLAAAYGTRAATDELVFHAFCDIYFKGTNTTAEMIESDGICIAVTSDWQTGIETTKPIAPSIARVYYGEYYHSMPIVALDPDGLVHEVFFKKLLKNPAPSPKP